MVKKTFTVLYFLFVNSLRAYSLSWATTVEPPPIDDWPALPLLRQSDIRRYTKRRPLAHGVMCSQTSSHTGYLCALVWALLHHLQHKVSVQELYQQNRWYRREKGSTQKVTGHNTDTIYTVPAVKMPPHVAGQQSVTSAIASSTRHLTTLVLGLRRWLMHGV